MLISDNFEYKFHVFITFILSNSIKIDTTKMDLKRIERNMVEGVRPPNQLCATIKDSEVYELTYCLARWGSCEDCKQDCCCPQVEIIHLHISLRRVQCRDQRLANLNNNNRSICSAENSQVRSSDPHTNRLKHLKYSPLTVVFNLFPA